MEQLTKYCVIFFLIFTWANAQKDSNFFITNDTVTIENPVIVSIKNVEGMFITDQKFIRKKRKIDVKKMLEDGTAYLFSDEFYRFLSKDELQKKIIYQECTYTTQSEIFKKFSLKKIDGKVKRFLLCFVKIDFYIDRTITSDNSRTLFSEKYNDNFKIIAFPICEKVPK